MRIHIYICLLLFFFYQANAQQLPYNTSLPSTERVPEFPGGQAALFTFLAKNMHYPSKALNSKISGRVIAGMVIRENGKVDSIKIEKSLNPECDKEVIRVIKLMPRWIPGLHQGIVSSIKISLPFDFALKKGIGSKDKSKPVK